MSRRILLALGAMALALTGLPSPADGSTLVKKNLAQLAACSERIVVARVVGSTARWTANGRLIRTDTALLVEQTIWGPHEKTLTVSEIGGTVGGTTLRVAGIPTFVAGERIVLAVSRDAQGQWITTGAIQGRFTIRRNRLTHQDVVVLEKGLAHVTRGMIDADDISAGGTIELDVFSDRFHELAVAEHAKKAKAGQKRQGEKR